MKKRNASIQAAVAILLSAASVSSFAGTAQGLAINLAAQAAISNAIVIRPGSVAYSTAVPLPIGTAYVKVTLGGGAKFLGAAAATVAAGALVAANSGAGTVNVAQGVISTDQSSVIFPISVTGASTPILTTLTFRPLTLNAADGAVNTVGFLSVVGATLPTSMSIGSSTAISADVDTVSTSNSVVSVNGITTTVLASNAPTFVSGVGGGAVETKKIQVATGTGIVTVDGTTGNTQGTANLINFGGFKFVDGAGAVAADGATTFNMAGNYLGGSSTLNAVLTGNFGAAVGTGGKVFLSSTANCSSITATATVNATTATFAGVTTPVTGVSSFVCMQVNTSNTILIPATTPTLVTTVTGATAATASLVSASASLYPLVNNGALIRVNSYIPASSVGYSSFIRVINTGSVAAPVTASVVDQVTGIAGTASVIVSSLAAGGSTTLTSTQVEAAVGTIATSANRPTLQITAPTSLAVQSFMLSPNGTFTLVSGQEF